MDIYIKIGTLPGRVMHLCRKRKLPIIGDLVEVKSENKRFIKAERVLIDGIKNVGGENLYFAERY